MLDTLKTPSTLPQRNVRGDGREECLFGSYDGPRERSDARGAPEKARGSKRECVAVEEARDKQSDRKSALGGRERFGHIASFKKQSSVLSRPELPPAFFAPSSASSSSFCHSCAPLRRSSRGKASNPTSSRRSLLEGCSNLLSDGTQQHCVKAVYPHLPSLPLCTRGTAVPTQREKRCLANSRGASVWDVGVEQVAQQRRTATSCCLACSSVVSGTALRKVLSKPMALNSKSEQR